MCPEHRIPAAVQRDIDAVGAAYARRDQDSEALARLTRWLESDDGKPLCQNWSESIVGLPPKTVARCADSLDDGEVGATLDLAEETEVTGVHRLQFLEGRLGALMEDGDESWAFTPVSLRTSDDIPFVLVSSSQGYSFDEIRTAWAGPFESFVYFVRNVLIAHDWVTDLTVFSQLPSLEKSRRLGLPADS